MVIDLLDCADTYAGLHPDFALAFSFLRTCDCSRLPEGKIEMAHGRLSATVMHKPGRSRDEALLEVHRKFIDIQCAFAGTDSIGWKPLSACAKPAGEFDTERDIQFFADGPDEWVSVRPGMFAVFFPQDAHAPMVSEGMLHKVVIKVAL